MGRLATTIIQKKKTRQQDDERPSSLKFFLSKMLQFNDFYSFEYSLFGMLRFPKWFKIAFLSPSLRLCHTHMHTRKYAQMIFVYFLSGELQFSNKVM